MIRPRGPLGFVASVLAIWLAARSGAIYWLSGEDVLALTEPPAPRPTPAAAFAPPPPLPSASSPEPIFPGTERHWSVPRPAQAMTVARPLGFPTAPAAAAAAQSGAPDESQGETFLAPFAAGPPPERPGPRRLRGSAWLFLRDEGGTSLAGAGQLGGSQAGARLTYAFGANGGGPALFARLSAPLEQPRGKEAALGIEWRPLARIPLALSAERRVGLDREGRDALALGVIAGVSDVKLPSGFRLEGYAQAGIVGAKALDAYVEASARVERPLLKFGGAQIAAGIGVWGGAQPGVERLDLGPQLSARFRAGELPLRLILDWRERIGGDARPGSGPALTLAADF